MKNFIFVLAQGNNRKETKGRLERPSRTQGVPSIVSTRDTQP